MATVEDELRAALQEREQELKLAAGFGQELLRQNEALQNRLQTQKRVSRSHAKARASRKISLALEGVGGSDSEQNEPGRRVGRSLAKPRASRKVSLEGMGGCDSDADVEIPAHEKRWRVAHERLLQENEQVHAERDLLEQRVLELERYLSSDSEPSDEQASSQTLVVHSNARKTMAGMMATKSIAASTSRRSAWKATRNEELDQLSQLLEKSKQQESELRDQLDQLQHQVLDSEVLIGSLRSEAKEQKRKLKEADVRCGDMCRKLESRQAELAQAKQRISFMESSVEKAHATMMASEASLRPVPEDSPSEDSPSQPWAAEIQSTGVMADEDGDMCAQEMQRLQSELARTQEQLRITTCALSELKLPKPAHRSSSACGDGCGGTGSSPDDAGGSGPDTAAGTGHVASSSNAWARGARDGGLEQTSGGAAASTGSTGGISAHAGVCEQTSVGAAAPPGRASGVGARAVRFEQTSGSAAASRSSAGGISARAGGFEQTSGGAAAFPGRASGVSARAGGLEKFFGGATAAPGRAGGVSARARGFEQNSGGAATSPNRAGSVSEVWSRFHDRFKVWAAAETQREEAERAQGADQEGFPENARAKLWREVSGVACCRR